MTNRILTSLKTFALGAAIRGSARRLRRDVETKIEPRVRGIDASQSMNGFDEWMFDKSTPYVSQEAYALSQDMSRVSGALSGLRAVLGSIAAQAPVMDVPVRGIPHAPLLSDDGLFDGEPMAASYGDVPDAHADLFVEMAEEEFRQVA